MNYYVGAAPLTQKRRIRQNCKINRIRGIDPEEVHFIDRKIGGKFDVFVGLGSCFVETHP